MIKVLSLKFKNALLAKHDLILLGLRGQAKTQIIRLLPRFLDEYSPAPLWHKG